jgi:hypothetical protein
MTRRLGDLWWDNTKVRGPSDRATRQALAGWVFRHLRDGRSEAAIRSALDKALHRLHGTATDRGEVFQISSSLARADGILQRDERPVEERVAKFYRERQVAWAEYRRFRTHDSCSPSPDCILATDPMKGRVEIRSLSRKGVGQDLMVIP